MAVYNKELIQWKKLRSQVKNSYSYDSDWKSIIELFQFRFEKKFFDPLDEIIKLKKQMGEGFTIVTVQCALIESLASYKKGLIYNHKMNRSSPNYQYKNSRNLFIDFLLTESIFEKIFWVYDENKIKKINFPFNADSFYTDVRCGLIHEARTKNQWSINTIKTVKSKTNFLESEGDRIKIYRTILQSSLKTYFSNYCDDLTLQDSKGKKLRRFLGRKFDSLYDIKKDKSYDWWRQDDK